MCLNLCKSRAPKPNLALSLVVRPQEALVSPTAVNYDHSASREYLGVVRQHVIQPLETRGVAESCFAEALLVFGAMDGLGKLTHANDAAPGGPGQVERLVSRGQTSFWCNAV